MDAVCGPPGSHFVGMSAHTAFSRRRVGTAHQPSPGTQFHWWAVPTLRLLGLATAPPKALSRQATSSADLGTACQPASVAPAAARNGIFLARTGHIACDYDASAKDRRQQGHSASCPVTTVNSAVGCGRVVIALSASGARHA